MNLLILLAILALVFVLGGSAGTGIAIAGGILFALKVGAWIVGICFVVGLLAVMFKGS